MNTTITLKLLRQSYGFFFVGVFFTEDLMVLLLRLYSSLSEQGPVLIYKMIKCGVSKTAAWVLFLSLKHTQFHESL